MIVHVSSCVSEHEVLLSCFYTAAVLYVPFVATVNAEGFTVAAVHCPHGRFLCTFLDSISLWLIPTLQASPHQNAFFRPFFKKNIYHQWMDHYST